jgi:aminoglycoside 3-N-acetyltransferase
MDQQAQLREDLLALGLRPGGTLLVHSSLRALGPLPGGPQALIQALLQALGPEGTLLMPALTYARVTPQNPVFDLLETPSNVGLIPETFRRLPGVQRSLHPTHSVCGLGPLAAALLEPHAQDSTPCGPHSPFRALPERGGQVLMLGCGLEPNTSMHAIEELVVPEYLFDPPLTYTLRLPGGETRRKRYTPHNFRGWQQRYDRLGGLLSALGPFSAPGPFSARGLRRGPVLQAQAALIEAAAMWAAALPALRADPFYFVEPGLSFESRQS